MKPRAPPPNCSDIDDTTPPLSSNSLEINLLTNVRRCEAVGNDLLRLANVDQVACVNGTGQILSCQAGYYNLDGPVSNGCEVIPDLFEPHNDVNAAATSVLHVRAYQPLGTASGTSQLTQS